MATLSPSRDLTSAFERSLATATAMSARSVGRRLATVSARSIAGDWPMVSKAIARDILAGQESATVLSSWYMQEAVRSTLHVASRAPDLPAMAGRTASGMSIARYVDRTPDIVAARIADGMKPDLALAVSERRLVSLATTEPYRVGRGSVAYASINDANYSGWQRVTEAGACDFCEMLATRGDAYTSKASAESTSKDLAFHANCHCYAEPVLAKDAPALRAAGEQAWAATEARPTAYRTGTRSTGRSRGATSAGGPRADATLFLPGSGTAERLASVDLQITQIESRMTEMSARLAAGDASMAKPVEWNTRRLAELRAERGT